VLLFERKVLKKDFAEILIQLEPQIAQARPGELASQTFPHLRRLAVVGEGACEGAIESWPDFLAHGEAVSKDLVEAIAGTTKPSDSAVLYFSSGSTGKAKGILSAHRGVTIQCWRWKRMWNLQDNVRCWSANGFFWSGNFCMALGATLSAGGSLVLQPTFDPAVGRELRRGAARQHHQDRRPADRRDHAARRAGRDRREGSHPDAGLRRRAA
jgi:fatty-acyl-CoA synthase